MREILVTGPKVFKISVPDEAKITFGPWSPGMAEGSKYGGGDKALNGTLRVYATAKAGATMLACFSGITAFRELSVAYTEQVAVEEGAIMWKSDRDGYTREEKVKRSTDWELSDGKES